MKTKNQTVLKIMNVLFWIVFIGLCIKTGALLVSFFVSLFVNTEGAKNLYRGLDLYELYSFNKAYYIQTVSFLIVLCAQKAYIAYLVIVFFLKFNLSKPFSKKSTDLFISISHISLGAGILAILAQGHSEGILKKGVEVPIDWGASEILFFAGVIYLLALVFKKGTELQTENDFTV